MRHPAVSTTLLFVEIKNYELVRRLAQGGMAEIYLAKQKAVAGFERLVVVKRVLPELVSDRDFIESFLDEARNGAQLNHPNIVQTIELGEEGGTYFIALEYIDGIDAAKLLRVHRTAGTFIPVDVALRLGCDLLAGLEHAHNATNASGEPMGLVHRDVSPSNLLIAFSGAAKVVDFGIAKATSKLEGRTKTGYVKGKLSYLAPEQAQRAKLDRRVDVFAAGIVLFELLTGQHPFRGESELETLSNLMNRPAPKLREHRPDLPAALEDVIDLALAKDPNVRFGSAALFQQRLEAATDLKLSAMSVRAHLQAIGALLTAPSESADDVVTTHQPIRTATGQAPAPPTPPQQKRRPRSIVLAAISGASLIALAVAAALILRPTPKLVLASEPALAPPVAEPASTQVVATPKPIERKPSVKTAAKPVIESKPATELKGELKILVKPWATVQLDDADLGYSPVKAQIVSTGKHRITFSNKDLGKQIVRDVDIPTGGTITLRVDMLKEN